MELLSPAGSYEALLAAVQNGADAVYMGLGGFNARRSARNFTDEDFARAVDYCHERGVKVYLTLNTLLTDRELPEAAEVLRKASAWGVDAVLVQDWGLWQLARLVAPDQPLHASTQMSLHTLSGARLAAELGMERVVLARELSNRDVETICRGCGAEVEVFGHGALCMCYSGQCAMSALIGQRSGNRGTCAQPCRLPYTVGKKTGYLLSLKDNNLSPYLRQMEEMGVSCVKLEGRMKRPEYVAAVTGIYRRLLDEKRPPPLSRPSWSGPFPAAALRTDTGRVGGARRCSACGRRAPGGPRIGLPRYARPMRAAQKTAPWPWTLPAGLQQARRLPSRRLSQTGAA